MASLFFFQLNLHTIMSHHPTLPTLQYRGFALRLLQVMGTSALLAQVPVDQSVERRVKQTKHEPPGFFTYMDRFLPNATRGIMMHTHKAVERRPVFLYS